MRFLLDANMPRLALDLLREFGHEAARLRDPGLAAATDEIVARVARKQDRILVTRDFDFADIRRYPPETLPGIIVVAVPDDVSADAIGRLLREFLAQQEHVEYCAARLAILEFGRVRYRPA